MLKKNSPFYFLCLFLIISCTREDSMVFRQDRTGNDPFPQDRVYKLGFSVNPPIESRDREMIPYIKPLDTPVEDIKMVSVIPAKPIDRPLKVGFSQMEVNNAWRIYENASIFEEAKRLGIDLIYKDARSSIKKQNSDIIELLEENPDYLIIAPREFYGLRDALKAARDDDVPVILIDRITDGEPGVDYVTCIMGDFIEVGRRAAEILAVKFPEQKILVFEVSGTIGSSVSRDLSRGFRSVADSMGWEIMTVDGDFDRAASVQPIEQVLQTDGHRINAVFTHVDDSAIAALQAMKAVGITPGTDVDAGEIPIVSMCGYKDAMKAIIAGEMLATIECTPRFGPAVFEIIRKLENGESIPSRIVMPGKTYDLSNTEDLIELEGY